MNFRNESIFADSSLQKTKEALGKYFGFSDFRDGQEEIIKSVLGGQNTVVIMPTGAGKSLCYQLPALILDGVTIVISPLISLMKDQVDDLASRNIPATFINSSLTLDEIKQRFTEIRAGGYKLVYIAPERFYSQEFLNLLKEIKISLFAIDEAHCISEWGHDFRPSYLKMGRVVEFLGWPPVIALTATATPEVKNDIVKQLNLENPKIVVTGFDRKNLLYYVVRTPDITSKQYKVLEIIEKVGKPGIIYAGTRSSVDSLVEFLKMNNLNVLGYHAGMDDEDRKSVQNRFMSGRADIIVATNAFGMGIDKSNIRFVIHHDMPGTLEAYYQEAGRAGRDGKKSYCIMLYHPRDRHLRDFFIKGDNPPRSLIESLYELLKMQSGEPILMTYSEILDQLSSMGSIKESMPETSVGTAMAVLEREGYIKRSTERAKSAYIRFLYSETEITSKVSKRAKKQIQTLELFIKRLSGYLLDGVNFYPEKVAGDSDLAPASLTRAIKSLRENNLVEYEPPFRGREIYLTKREEKLNVDFSALKEKRKRDYGKLDTMEEYIYTSGCRRKYILEYFGDASASKKCNSCDVCMGFADNTQEPPAKPWKKNKNHKKSSLDEEYEVNVSAPRVLNTKPTQFETYELYKKGLTPDEISKAREIGLEEIMEHFNWLKTKGVKV